MFDREIQTASEEVLRKKLREIGPYPDNAGQIDLGIRIAKELRRRKRFQIAKEEKTTRR